MKKIKTKITSKLKSNAGESLAEVLIALLIAALALTMLASVITTSSRIITQTKEKMKIYYEANNSLSAQAGTPTTKLDLTITVKSWKFKNSGDTEFSTTNHVHPNVLTATYTTHLINDDAEVYYYENDTLGTTKVVSYKKK